jgi:methylated-DNA-[protein]-cysteine S-methyltransferase
MQVVYFSEISSPIGQLLLLSNGKALLGLHMDEQHNRPDTTALKRNDAVFAEVHSQLCAYFDGTLKKFDFPIHGIGTAFQQQVWQQLQKIPYGTTQTYGELARKIANPNASRAVGLANGRNPIGIIVPCHRVIGANGTLTGYAGGLWRKQWLLAHEQRYRQGRLAID